MSVDRVVTLDEDALPSGFLELRSAVASAARFGEPTLVVDISRLDRLSSSALTALLWPGKDAWPTVELSSCAARAAGTAAC